MDRYTECGRFVIKKIDVTNMPLSKFIKKFDQNPDSVNDSDDKVILKKPYHFVYSKGKLFVTKG